MKHLKELHEKLEEYNRAENESWMILIDKTRLNYVFIVSEENINLFPSWWPVTDVAETTEKALELMPKEEMFRLIAYGNKGGQLALAGRYTKSQLKQIADLCL